MRSLRRTYFTSLSVSGRFVALLLLMSFQQQLQAQVQARVDTTTIRIGEEIRYQLEVAADSTQLVLFPEGQTFLPLEVIESIDPDTLRENDRYRLIKRYGLTQFDSGHYTIPPQKIVIGDKVYSSDSIKVEVRDVPVDTTRQKMFDIKPAIAAGSPPLNWGRLLTWLIPLLLVAAGLLIWRYRKKKAAAAEIVLEPLEEALANLKALDNSDYLRNGRTKAYYSDLTDILKRYLYREIDQGVMERTSEELIVQLRLLRDAGRFDFSERMITELDMLLKRADLVKFARQDVAREQISADRSRIESWVVEAQEAIPEPTEEELKETAEFRLAQQARRKRRRLIVAGSAAIAGIVLIAMIYGSLAGFDRLRDLVFGNELRELAEGRWYRSEYGNPSIVMETPEILIRAEVAADSLERPVDLFSYGSERDPFYISVFTGPLQQTEGENVQVNLERLLDQALADLEAKGAKNMLVKRAEFETENGLKGLKAFGEFNVQVSENRVLKNASQYELILFAQPGSIQQILLVYQDDGRYAEGIKERILNSIELELQKKAAKDG